MKVMFIDSVGSIKSTSKPLESWSKVQYGISYISSTLKAHGHETRLAVLGSDKWEESTQLLRSLIEEFDPAVVCYTAVFSQYSFIEKIAGFVRSNWPDKFSVVGGVHATLNPEDVIKGPFDALCIGEGEDPVAELCDRLEGRQVPEGIENLWYKSSNGAVSRTGTRDFIKDLDVFPFPDREMWKPWIKDKPNDEIAVLVGRGCPYDCTYCSNHAIRKTAKGKYVRMRSPENIVREIAYIYDNFPQRRIYLEAESLALDKKWAFEFCRQLESFNAKIGKAVSYGCNLRVSPQTIDEHLFIAFEKANFYKINIGLESGSERVRREILKRNYSNDDFLKVTSMARKHNMLVNVYNLIGIPGESLSDHMETVRVNRQCQPDSLCTSIFYPYPGTELYRTCIEQGLINDSAHTTKERRTAVLDLPDFSKAQIQTAYKRFNSRVYKGSNSWWKLLVLHMHGWIPRNSRLYNMIVRVPFASELREKVKRQFFSNKKHSQLTDGSFKK